MKSEFNADELRQSAEDIRSAVMPKSITPDMVGGTLLGVVNALGEVVEVLGEIPQEHVRVKVKGYDGDGIVSAVGAKVEVEVFCVNGFPCAQIEKRTLIVGDSGAVEFDVPHGFTFAVRSKLDGMGASFEMVFDASRKERTVNLWHLPVGIFAYGQAGICTDKYYGPSYPLINKEFDASYDFDTDWIDEDLASDADWKDQACGVGETAWLGILVSTVDTAFVITPDSLSADYMQWSGTFGYGVEVPYCGNYNPDDMDVSEGENAWTKARDLAMTDFNGHSNTAKILRNVINPTAAKWASERDDNYYDQHNFLPSAGQMYLIWLNRTAINKLMEQYNDEIYEGFELLPYKNEKGNWQLPNGHYEYWWTSTQAGANCSWVVNYNGSMNRYYSDSTRNVRAVSAFHFEY